MNPTLENPVVKEGFQEGHKAFEIYVDDSSQAAGFTQFLEVTTSGTQQRIFPHTVVREELGGHGLASILVREALNTSIEEGYRIVALCPYIKKWLTKHPDYNQYLDAPTSQHLQALSS